jgi:hypothetical protein
MRFKKETAELPRFARVTFFVAKKVTKENSQCRGKSAVGDMAGIFRCGILPRRKTAHIVCAALRVSDSWVFAVALRCGETIAVQTPYRLRRSAPPRARSVGGRWDGATSRSDRSVSRFRRAGPDPPWAKRRTASGYGMQRTESFAQNRFDCISGCKTWPALGTQNDSLKP